MSTQTQTDVRQELKTPSLWKVILHNDDFTPMDFVTQILVYVFNKSQDEAERLMMTIHLEGKAVIGLYTKDIALTKTAKVSTLSEENGHPLMATAEEG